MQSVYTLPYGAGLALTTSKYYTPAGRNIQRDYTSFFDYYVADESEAGEIPKEDREVFKTETGRVVYGGGGITPDVIVKPLELSRVVQLLEVRSAIFDYAVRYAAKNPALTRDVAVSAPMMEEFILFAAEKKIATAEEIRKALENPVDRQFVQRALRAEIVAAKFGYEASYPIRIQGDNQVARAIELLSDAEKLASAARDHRSGVLAERSVPATSRRDAAANVPQ